MSGYQTASQIWVDAPTEQRGAMPAFKPGDVVLTKDGGIGIIVKAQVILNGMVFDWNDHRPFPTTVENARTPNYALEQVPGCAKIQKNAWWTTQEWRAVMLGPLHDSRLFEEGTTHAG